MAKTYEKNLRVITALKTLSPNTPFHLDGDHIYFECRAADALETLRVLLAETGVTFQPAKAADLLTPPDKMLRYELKQYDAQALFEHAARKGIPGPFILPGPPGGGSLGRVATAPIEHAGDIKGL
jgi:hypothetical protein